MTVHDQLQDLFRTVFNDDSIVLSDSTTASDIEGWDSVATINLMFMVEQTFGVQFAGSEFGEFANVGELIAFLDRRRAA